MTHQSLIEIEDKLREISRLILDYSLKVEHPEFTSLLYIKGNITFFEGSSLVFSQLLAEESISYRFHFMDPEKKLILRWDSAPHHRDLESFPHHIHTPEGVFPSKQISLPQIIDKAIEIILGNA